MTNLPHNPEDSANPTPEETLKLLFKIFREELTSKQLASQPLAAEEEAFLHQIETGDIDLPPDWEHTETDEEN